MSSYELYHDDYHDDDACDFCRRPSNGPRIVGDELLCQSCELDERDTYRRIGQTLYRLGFSFPFDEHRLIRQGWILAEKLDQPAEERAA